MLCDLRHLSYEQWRLDSGLFPALRDNGDCPPERLVQAIWRHQRLRREKLVTMDGRPVRILHPGFQNFEGGPDFKSAVIQFGDVEVVSGDVEVDLRSSGWRAHGHDVNPRFQQVILHVVWDAEKPASGVPATLVLNGRLDAPLGELSVCLGAETTRPLPENCRGKCAEILGVWDDVRTRELLRQAALVRLKAKAESFQARARDAGWEQALWEGAFRALGYKHNPWPMHWLAQERPRWSSPVTEPFALQARLFGISGLLPADLERRHKSADAYVRRVWDFWWREREMFSDCVLPRAVWRFHGLRPANHPHRRVALAAQWASIRDLPARVEKWCARHTEPRELRSSLLELLQPAEDEFWSWHWTLGSARLARPQPLLGEDRATEIAVNAVLPWLFARASEGSDHRMVQSIQDRYLAWPAGQDNSVLKQATERLLGRTSKSLLRTAAEQQGLMQIVRDFCDGSNAICDDCKFPARLASSAAG